MKRLVRQIGKSVGLAGAGARRRESNKIKRQMRNAARRRSAGGQGG
mgnify:CR=1 FL=1